MGYRKLLKDYMRHIESAIGNNFVELASLTNALGKRDIGELRAIAAELQRESYSSEPTTNNYNHLVRELLLDGKLHVEQLNRIDGIDPGDEDEAIPEEKFRRLLLFMVEYGDTDTSQD